MSNISTAVLYKKGCDLIRTLFEFMSDSDSGAELLGIGEWNLLDTDTDESESEDLQDNRVHVIPYMEDGVYRLRRISYFNEEIFSIFQDRIRNTFPVLITDFVSEWPAINKWKSPEYLAQLFGAKTVTNYEAKDNLSFFKNELTIHHKMPGDEMVRRILTDQEIKLNPSTTTDTQPQRWYCRGGFRKRFLGDVKLPYRIVYPSIEAEQKDPEMFSLPFRKHNCTVWVGTAGNITPLHFDMCHGLLCQVIGVKRVTFFHKDDYRSVYPTSYGHINRAASQLIDYKGYSSGDKVSEGCKTNGKLMHPITETTRKIPKAQRFDSLCL